MAKKEVRLLSKPEVLDRVGVTFPTLWKWMLAGKFPRSRNLFDGKVAWVESEVEEWISSLPIQPLKGDEEAARRPRRAQRAEA